ncbi:MAG: hypothetical protein ACLPZM_02660 [Thermoplasmata archaeon]
MPDPEVAAPVVPMPAPVERRLRLGPFASARDALKFVTYAAVAALLAPFVSPFAWLPLVALGFVLSVWRPEGEALDERVGRWIGWSWRRLGSASVTSESRGRTGGSAFVRLGSGRYATILRLNGTPVAYRPPAELERLFREYGEVLRASEGVLVLRVGTAPLGAEPLLPRETSAAPREQPAHAGYRELVEVLCRRRLVRRIDLALFGSGSDSDAPARLDSRTRALAGRLRGLGLRPCRLRGRSLAEAAHRLGWSPGAGEE